MPSGVASDRPIIIRVTIRPGFSGICPGVPTTCAKEQNSPGF